MHWHSCLLRCVPHRACATVRLSCRSVRQPFVLVSSPLVTSGHYAIFPSALGCNDVWPLQTPEWNETVDVWEAHSTGGHIEVQLWDDDRMRGDDHIATCFVDIGRTLIAAHPSPQQDTPGATLYPALPPEEGVDGAAPVQPLLPSDEVITRDVLLVMPAAKHRRGTPRVFLRLTWMPVDAPAEARSERQGSPLVPWRPTGLQPMRGVLPPPGAPLPPAALTVVACRPHILQPACNGTCSADSYSADSMLCPPNTGAARVARLVISGYRKYRM